MGNLNNELSKQFFGLINPEIPLPVTGVTSRVFYYLRNNELVDYPLRDKNEKRERVKLNYFQAFWLLMTKELRIYGMPDKHLRIVKDFMYCNIASLLKKGMIPNNYPTKYLHALGFFTPKVESTFNFSNKFETSLVEDMIIGGEEKDYYTNLGLALNLLLIGNEDPFLLITDNSEGITEDPISIKLLSSGNGQKLAKEILDPKHSSKIILSFRSIYSKLFELDLKSETFLNYRLISAREKKVLDTVEKGDFKELTIKRKGKDLVMKLKKDGEVTGEDVKTLRRILGSNDFKNVALKYRNDKYTYFERDQEIKL